MGEEEDRKVIKLSVEQLPVLIYLRYMEKNGIELMRGDMARDDERHNDIDDYIPEEKKKIEAWEEGARKEIRQRKMAEKNIQEMEFELSEVKAIEEQRLEDFAFHFPLQEKFIKEHYQD